MSCENIMAHLPKLDLPYTLPLIVSFSADELVALDELARQRLGISDNKPMSTMELLNQACLDKQFTPENDNWEHEFLDWPIRHTDKKRIAQETEFLFTHEELLDWLEAWERDLQNRKVKTNVTRLNCIR